jgi:hypothetical protein
VRSPNMARSSLCAVFSLFSIVGIRFCWSAHHDDDDDAHDRDHAPRKNSRPCADLNPGPWSQSKAFASTPFNPSLDTFIKCLISSLC